MAEWNSFLATARDGRPVRALVVDDNTPVRRMLFEIVRRLGADPVFQAGSVAEAVAVAQNESIDLLFTDLQMPGQSGVSLVRRLRSGEAGAENALAAIVAVSGRRSADAVRAAVAAGVDDFVAKPVVPHNLAERAKRALAAMDDRRTRPSDTVAENDAAYI